MRTSNSTMYKNIVDESDFHLKIEEEDCYAVIFLHCFSDAAYFFGTNDFMDLRDWLDFTISSLRRNNKVSRILIKPHPNLNFNRYPVDEVAMTEIRSKHPSDEVISWIPADLTPIVFTNFGRPVGITHHGSVAEELVHLGVPVISSRQTPYQLYRFSRSWGSRREYLSLINSIGADTFSRNILVPIEIPVGLVTTAIGGPVFLWLLGRLRSVQWS